MRSRKKRSLHHVPTRKYVSRSHMSKAKGSPVQLTVTDRPSVSAKTAPERKEPILSVPLDREHYLKSLQESLAKIKEGSTTVTNYVIVLEQWSDILKAEWNRDKLEINSSSQEFQYIR
ncbi:MAG: hypothetical protein ABSF09_11490 [Candidatus Bathyarchaeia archaeon]